MEEEDGNKGLFITGEGIEGSGGRQGDENRTGLERLGDTLRDTAQDLGEDTLNSVTEAARGFGNSLQDLALGRNSRRGEISGEYNKKEVSLANRHKEQIRDILNNVGNGNLFDAGLSALNLYNFGTKWTIVVNQYTDKELEAFKYNLMGINDNNETEQDGLTFGHLDSIEDPTILGYSFLIKTDKSPLFKDNGAAENFIEKYSGIYREMSLAKDYLFEFKKEILKIFSTYENVGDNSSDVFKNHYIQKVDGLDKLDEFFVKYPNDENIGEHDLKLTLHEDVRMSISKLAMVYRNLTYSYNMGKKLLPENLLRFNMYIKVSDQRNYTNKKGGDNNKIYGDAISNHYSRVVYELKDCEFFFDNNAIPNSIEMGGYSGISSNYSTMDLRIKFRKVNRFFYSKLFDENFNKLVLSDKYFMPDKLKALEGLRDNFIGKGFEEAEGNGVSSKSKKDRTDNNIPVGQSIKERYSKLKNQGLFSPTGDDDDNALTRFVKGVGNDFIRSGVELTDEGLKNIENSLRNNQSIRNALKDRMKNKTKNLGDVHGDSNQSITSPSRVRNRQNVTDLDRNKIKRFDAENPSQLNEQPNQADKLEQTNLYEEVDRGVENPSGYLHEDVNREQEELDFNLHEEEDFDVENPSGDVHGESDFEREKPNEDKHEEEDYERTSPSGDLHGESDFERVNPSGDLHRNSNYERIIPDEDVHEGDDSVINRPRRDLHLDSDESIIRPLKDLHESVDDNIRRPSEDLHLKAEDSINRPSNDLHEDVGNNIRRPSEDLHLNSDKNIDRPSGDLHGESNKAINNPSGDLHGEEGGEVEEPSLDNLNEADDKIINIPTSEKVNGEVEYERATPDNNVNEDVNKSVENPVGDLHGVVDKIINKPSKESLNDDVENNIEQPRGDLHESGDNNINRPSEDLNEEDDSVINKPIGDKHKKSEKKVQSPNDNVNKDFRDFLKKKK